MKTMKIKRKIFNCILADIKDVLTMKLPKEMIESHCDKEWRKDEVLRVLKTRLHLYHHRIDKHKELILEHVMGYLNNVPDSWDKLEKLINCLQNNTRIPPEIDSGNAPERS